MKIKRTPAALVVTAFLALILSSSVFAEEQKQDDKKEGNKQSAAAQPHAPAPQHQQVQRQAVPRAIAPQREQVRQQAAPRVSSQQVNAVPRGNAQYSKHGNPVGSQQAQVSHVASQNERQQHGAAPNSISQNSQSGVSEKQNHRNRANSSQVVSSQQGVNGGAIRSPRQLSGGGASRAQSVNNGGGTQQYQVTPNAQYNGNNNYGGLWTQANTHSDWSHDGQHYWNDHNYRWYQGGWLIIDGLFNPFYSNGNVGYSNGGYNGSSMASSVQSRLNQLGYYNGPIDGDLGPGSRNAIANYQRDNNLYVNGRITNDLLQSLQLL